MGKYMRAAQNVLKKQGWTAMVQQLRSPPDIPEDVEKIPHPAGNLLATIRDEGIPVTLKSPPWTRQELDAAVARGPHQSVREYQDFLEGEMLDMREKGQWIVLPYNAVKNLPNLRLSPPGIVPQRDRRPRMISDYTFFGVNDDTEKLMPPEAMQFGKALHRLIHNVVEADPTWGPVRFAKIDVADGFYRVILKIQDIPKLGLLFPPDEFGVQRVAFPTVLPMGWVESPPGFCVVTETACDLANMYLKRRAVQPPHRLEQIANTPPSTATSVLPPPLPTTVGLPTNYKRPHKISVPQPLATLLPRHRRKPLSYWDVYVDDFLGQVQGGTHRQKQALRTLLHSFDRCFRPLEDSDPASRREPASIKKMKKGDAYWQTRKIMLGWILDAIKETIELPDHRLERLYEILRSLPSTKRRITTQRWHKIMGELRSMTLAIPGLKGLFSLLQEAFRHTDKKRVKLSQALHGFLNDIRLLALDLSARPTRMREVIPTPQAVMGTTDAARAGMGGVFFAPILQDDGTSKLQPYLWRAPFNATIQSSLVSWQHPQGTISNSDLELAGTIAQHDVVVNVLDVRERTLHTSSDNTPAVAWQTKGSTTTTGPAAYLLRIMAFHQRYHRYHPRFNYIPGPANHLADFCSRRWDLSDTELLTYFNSKFPQTLPWQLCQLRPAMLSSMTSALLKKRSDLELFLAEPTQQTRVGSFGPHFAPASIKTPTSPKLETLCPSSKCTPVESMTVDHPKAVTPSDLAQWTKSSVRWVRRSPYWGPLTRD